MRIKAVFFTAVYHTCVRTYWKHNCFPVFSACFPSKHDTFYCEGGWPVAQVARGGCGISILGDVQNQTGPGPGSQLQMVLPGRWGCGMDRRSPRRPFQPKHLCDSVTLFSFKARWWTEIWAWFTFSVISQRPESFLEALTSGVSQALDIMLAKELKIRRC